MRTIFKKRVLILGMAVLMAVTFFSFKPEAHAVPAWFLNVEIVQIGAAWGSNYICFNGGGLTNKWAATSASQSNAQLATALTAYSLTKRVNVYLDAAGPDETPIGALYIAN